MATPLEQLQERTGRAFTALTEARERTARRIAQRRALLDDLAVDDDATVVLMGSWGRRELTRSSDDDYMVLVRGARGPGAPRPTVAQVRQAFARDPGGFSAPGEEGIFADVVYSADLLARAASARRARRGSSPTSSTRPTCSAASASTTTRTRT